MLQTFVFAKQSPHQQWDQLSPEAELGIVFVDANTNIFFEYQCECIRNGISEYFRINTKHKYEYGCILTSNRESNVVIFSSVNTNFVVFIFPSANANYFLFKC